MFFSCGGVFQLVPSRRWCKSRNTNLAPPERGDLPHHCLSSTRERAQVREQITHRTHDHAISIAAAEPITTTQLGLIVFPFAWFDKIYVPSQERHVSRMRCV